MSGMHHLPESDNNKKFDEAKSLYLNNKKAVDLSLIKALKQKTQPRAGTIEISTMYFHDSMISQLQFLIDKIVDDYIFLDLKQVGKDQW